ncbi:MAG TPA: thiamine pyrophosphate-dependent enzyme [Solirubrobacterales bacterium]|nr:thiamine pyrophosphate-dependent enzyme [Solirubrobacterales bacterium]
MTATPASTEATAASAAIDALVDGGVTTLYCNPGTTELPFIRELTARQVPRYVLTLHEGAAVSGAAGHALATGRPGVAVVHAMPGAANALNMIYNVSRSHVPLVLIIGVQDLRHQFLDPMLQADVPGVLRPIAKRVWEAQTGEALGEVISLALRDAIAQPSGPVVVCVPLDIWDTPGGVATTNAVSALPRFGAAPVDQVEQLADQLVAADAPTLIVGDLAAQRQAGATIASLAAAAAATVRWAPACSLAGSLSQSPYHRGPIFPDARSFARAFEDTDMVLGIGAEVLPPTLFQGRELFPATLACATLNEVPEDDVGILRPQLSVYGDLPTTIEALDRAVRARATADPACERRLGARREALRLEYESERARLHERSRPREGEAGPMPARVAVALGLEAAPAGTVVVDEAVSNSGWVSLLGRFEDALSYVTMARGGGLGYALGVALGVQIASSRPVLTFVGDGALVYGPQALWTIAHENLPIVTCVLNNSSYEILKGFMRNHFVDASPTPEDAAEWRLDISAPALDTVALARSFGVASARVEDAASLREAVANAFASGKPWLIDVAIAGGP